MAKNTSTIESNSQPIEASVEVNNNVQASVEATEAEVEKSATVNTATAPLAPSFDYYDTKLQALESKLSLQIAKSKSGSGTGFLWAVVLLTLAAASYSGFTAFNNQTKLATIDNDYNNAQKKIDEATFKIEKSATLLEGAQSNNVALQQANQQLQQEHGNLVANDKVLTDKINELIGLQNKQSEEFTRVSDKVDLFNERNPNDWKLAESFFLVNNATQKAVFEQDTKAAIWMLTQADELLVNIETEEVLALREAISKDITTLKNLKTVDIRGMGLDLDRAFDNVDLLVLKEFSDAKTREATYEKKTETTADIKDWKQNLINSATDFASRFIEVRRRDPNAATEFLTPEQNVYLRENIKTRILLAKANLSNGDKEAMDKNLAEAIKLVKAYYDENSAVTTTTISLLDKLVQSDINIETPEVLASSQAFAAFAKEHLLGR